MNRRFKRYNSLLVGYFAMVWSAGSLNVPFIVSLLLILSACPRSENAVAHAQDAPTTNGFLEDLLGNLDISDSGSGEVEYFEPELVKGAAHDVLNSPEFRGLPQLDLDGGAQTTQSDADDEPLFRQESSARDSDGSIGEGFAEFLRALFGSATSVLIALFIALAIAGIIAAIVYVSRSWRDSETDNLASDDATDDEPAPLVAPGEKSPDAWLAAARGAAADGRFEEAVSLLLLGAMGHAERAGLIHPRRGLTHRDYLRVVPRGSAWHAALDRLIRTYAPIGFGRRPATAQTFDDVVASYETALAAEPIPPSHHSPA